MTFDLVKQKVDEFNTIAGNLKKKPTKKQLLAQIDLIQEELDEARDGVNDNDSEEFLDGIGDLVVTLFGLFSQAEKLGHDVMGATLAICDQNLDKFPVYPNHDLVKQTKEMYFNEKKTVAIDSVCSDVKPKRHVIKNGDTGKILKPIGFDKIDLSRFIGD